MAKIKVHELAKELGRQSKEVIAFLQNKGIEVKAAQSSVEDEAASMVLREMGGKEAGAAPGPAGKPAGPIATGAAKEEQAGRGASENAKAASESHAAPAGAKTVPTGNAAPAAEKAVAGAAAQGAAPKEAVGAVRAPEHAGKGKATGLAQSSAQKEKGPEGSQGHATAGKASQEQALATGAKGGAAGQGQARAARAEAQGRGTAREGKPDRGRESAGQGQREPVKKKKNIIFVSNPHNSKIQGGQQREQRGAGQGNGRRNRAGAGNSDLIRRPLIRPLTPPSPTPSVGQIKPTNNPPRRSQPGPAEAGRGQKEAAIQKNAGVPAGRQQGNENRPERKPQERSGGNSDYRNRQTDNRNAGNRFNKGTDSRQSGPGRGRNFGDSGRPERTNGREDNKFRKSAGAKGFAADVATKTGKSTGTTISAG